MSGEELDGGREAEKINVLFINAWNFQRINIIHYFYKLKLYPRHSIGKWGAR